jgi:hypothetical protein
MTYKIGTLKDLEEVQEKIPPDVYNKIHDIVSMLDREYGGADTRNIDTSDGGIVLFGDSNGSIAEVEKIINLDKRVPEWVERIGAEYLNVLYIVTNEYSINVIIKKDIAPKKLIEELED